MSLPANRLIASVPHLTSTGKRSTHTAQLEPAGTQQPHAEMIYYYYYCCHAGPFYFGFLMDSVRSDSHSLSHDICTTTMKIAGLLFFCVSHSCTGVYTSARGPCLCSRRLACPAVRGVLRRAPLSLRGDHRTSPRLSRIANWLRGDERRTLQRTRGDLHADGGLGMSVFSRYSLFSHLAIIRSGWWPCLRSVRVGLCFISPSSCLINPHC